MPLAASTALLGVRDEGRVRAGTEGPRQRGVGRCGHLRRPDRHGLSARRSPACAAPRNVDLVRSIGADDVVDYTRTDFTREPAAATTSVLDLVGNRSLRRPAAGPDARPGRWSCPAAASSPAAVGVRSDRSDAQGQAVGTVRRPARGPRCSRRSHQAPSTSSSLRELAEAGKLVPAIDRTYPLAAAADALRYLEAEHARAEGRHHRLSAHQLSIRSTASCRPPSTRSIRNRNAAIPAAPCNQPTPGTCLSGGSSPASRCRSRAR